MHALKLKVMVGIALIAILCGVSLRAGADTWSRDILERDEPGIRIVRHFDSGRFAFFTESGTWLIGFGVLTLALALNQWVSGDPNPEKSATQS